MQNLSRTNIIILMAVLMFTIAGCSRPITQEKVTDNIEDARKATEEAKEATLKAIEGREQLFVDYKETKIEELEDRIDDIDKSINDLEKTAKKSENRGASDNIGSAINDLESEKNTLRREIDNVKSIQQRDWSSSYENVNRAIMTLEEEIIKLTNSLAEYK